MNQLQQLADLISTSPSLKTRTYTGTITRKAGNNRYVITTATGDRLATSASVYQINSIVEVSNDKITRSFENAAAIQDGRIATVYV